MFCRKCCVDKTHVGLFIDAVDKNKFTIPTFASQAKCLAKGGRIKQKITGVQFFDDDSLILSRTLPDVRTGGNLTLTIIAMLFSKDYFREATDVYLNFDGASDNVCYTVVYGIAMLLHWANKAGWPLKRIYILRFKELWCLLAITTDSLLTFTLPQTYQVGHTHNQLDGTFGVLARFVYGRHCGGTTACDILSFATFDSRTFDKVCVSCMHELLCVFIFFNYIVDNNQIVK